MRISTCFHSAASFILVAQAESNESISNASSFLFPKVWSIESFFWHMLGAVRKTIDNLKIGT
jgi:hypothetical protein